jgi:hypothetical protein
MGNAFVQNFFKKFIVFLALLSVSMSQGKCMVSSVVG